MGNDNVSLPKKVTIIREYYYIKFQSKIKHFVCFDFFIETFQPIQTLAFL